ncbi:MAG TPA: LCCL domain-containing protein [Candidatus Rubrimentiphilum sp.]|nr:LCCL domain-containing protein [Candidatus Rubrimentiphilum sp.]
MTITRLIASLSLVVLAVAPAAAQAQGRTGWNQTANYLRGHNGVSYHFRCPAGGSFGSIWGTNVYTDDSSVCTAAVHAGKITRARGGLVLIQIRPGMSSYSSSRRHGVTSQSYGSWGGSFIVLSAQPMSTSYATPAPAPTAAYTPPPPPPIASGGSGWDATATSLRGNNGQRYSFACGAGGDLGSVWGTDVYTDDSSVCTAAVHAGIITQANGGTVTIEIRPGQSSYAASSRNGVDSQSYDSWDGSYVFVRNGVASAPPPAPATGSVSSGGNGWDANATSYRGRNGARFSYMCPAGGDLGSVWGTDVYTDDSSVCTAAVHAGIITQANGGTVIIEIRPGQSSYAASSRNGVDSQSYDSWDGSFVFVH